MHANDVESAMHDVLVMKQSVMTHDVRKERTIKRQNDERNKFLF